MATGPPGACSGDRGVSISREEGEPRGDRSGQARTGWASSEMVLALTAGPVLSKPDIALG